MAFWIGLYPKPFFQILEQPVNQIATVRARTIRRSSRGADAACTRNRARTQLP